MLNAAEPKIAFAGQSLQKPSGKEDRITMKTNIKNIEVRNEKWKERIKENQ